MSDVERVQWGLGPEPGKTKPPRFRGRIFRLILWGVLGLFAPYKILEWLVASGGYNVVINVLGLEVFVKIANGTITTNEEQTTVNLLILLRELLPLIGTFLINTFLVFWLPLTPKLLAVRLVRTFSFFFSVGVVAALVSLGLAAAIMPRGTLAELMIVPGLVLAFFVILMVFSPFIPFWPINVPDNRVWMIMDSGGHLLRYAGEGRHYLTPLQYAEPFDERGEFTVSVDDESYVSSDAYPYRLRLRIRCMFDPLQADPKKWIPLRDRNRQELADDLQSECEFIVRHEMARYWRDEIKLRETLHTIAMDISEAIKKRQELGISLVPLNGVNVILDPPEMIVDSRARRMFLEALAVAGHQNKSLEFKELLRLVSPQTNPNVGVNQQGQVTFALQPGARIDDAQPGPEESAAEETEATESVAWKPAGLPSGLDDTQPEESTETIETDAAPAKQADDAAFTPPANPIDSSGQVIDTHIENGIFVPRDPLLHPKDNPKD